MFQLALFNISHGFLDGIVRGYRNSLITPDAYATLMRSQSLSDLRDQLVRLRPLLASLPDAPSPSTLYSALLGDFKIQFDYLVINSSGPLTQLLNFVTQEWQIDNLLMMITGLSHGYPGEELLTLLNPLGLFEGLEAMTALSEPLELLETATMSPIGHYFTGILGGDNVNQVLDEQNLHVIRSLLHKEHLKAFHRWIMEQCSNEQALLHLVRLEADRRNLNLVLYDLKASENDRLPLMVDLDGDTADEGGGQGTNSSTTRGGHHALVHLDEKDQDTTGVAHHQHKVPRYT